MKTKRITLTVSLDVSKDIDHLTDTIGNRLYTLDAVEGVTVTEFSERQDTKFDEQIKAFNELYNLPSLDAPDIRMSTFELDEYLEKIYSIFKEELDEVEAIRNKISRGAPKIEILTELADWLGDLQVYCASEMRKFGIPASLVLGIIMASNMSKLGEDNKPIYDERGKVMKGPGYWKPEPMIQRALLALQRQALAAQDM